MRKNTILINNIQVIFKGKKSLQTHQQTQQWQRKWENSLVFFSFSSQWDEKRKENPGKLWAQPFWISSSVIFSFLTYYLQTRYR